MAFDWIPWLRQKDVKPHVTAPATGSEIAEVERAIDGVLPADLRELFLQTNGILDDGFGPILPLQSIAKSDFVDGSGSVKKAGTFPRHKYSISQYTLLQRKLWSEDAGVDHESFVVVGVDIGGNLYGFFSGSSASTKIQCVAHDDGSIEPPTYTLEQYLLYYLAECRWFDDER